MNFNLESRGEAQSTMRCLKRLRSFHGKNRKGIGNRAQAE